jgi:hypothetical protein
LFIVVVRGLWSSFNWLMPGVEALPQPMFWAKAAGAAANKVMAEAKIILVVVLIV